MNTPTYFSVVIPLYNKADYIEKTLRSVLDQTYPNFEVVVVNDGSSDGCDKIVAGIPDDRIRLIHQENAGVSAARNHGIREAQYEHIALLDGDDWWGEQYLEKMNELVQKYPDAAMYAATYARVIEGKVVHETAFFDEAVEDTCFDLVEFMVQRGRIRFPINSSNTTLKKAAVLKAGYFDERIRNYEDYDLFLRVAAQGNLAVANGEPLSFYCQDVPAENRGSAGVLNIRNHLLYYMDKYTDAAQQNPELKLYLDRFKLNGLRIFVENGWIEKSECRAILRDVDEQNFSFVNKMNYSFSLLGYVFIKINVFRRRLFWALRRG